MITFQTETDVTGLNYVIARQDDGENFRLWEVAGTAHGDVYTIVTGRADPDGGARYAAVIEISDLPEFISCNQPFNAGPMHYVFNTAIRRMDNWIRTGEAPPNAPPRWILNDDQSDYLKDDLGNSTGGVRTPYVDAPSAIFSGVGNTGDGFCRLFGSTFLFDADQMASLYVDADGFTAAVTEAANAAVDAGFLLQDRRRCDYRLGPSAVGSAGWRLDVLQALTINSQMRTRQFSHRFQEVGTDWQWC